jgi:hypothetical protein
MPGIIKGYEYDIFISYRQNDNRYDNRVSDFVAGLTRELEATIVVNSVKEILISIRNPVWPVNQLNVFTS